MFHIAAHEMLRNGGNWIVRRVRSGALHRLHKVPRQFAQLSVARILKGLGVTIEELTQRGRRANHIIVAEVSTGLDLVMNRCREELSGLWSLPSLILFRLMLQNAWLLRFLVFLRHSSGQFQNGLRRLLWQTRAVCP